MIDDERLAAVLHKLGELVEVTNDGIVVDVEVDAGIFRSFIPSRIVSLALDEIMCARDWRDAAEGIAGLWASEVDNARLQSPPRTREVDGALDPFRYFR